TTTRSTRPTAARSPSLRRSRGIGPSTGCVWPTASPGASPLATARPAIRTTGRSLRGSEFGFVAARCSWPGRLFVTRVRSGKLSQPQNKSSEALVITISFRGAGLALLAVSASAADPVVLTNHLGYPADGPKRAVVQGHRGDHVAGCFLERTGGSERTALPAPEAAGPVGHWRDWHYWTLDFSSFTRPGTF